MTTGVQTTEEDLSSRHVELRRLYLPVERKLRSLGTKYIFAGAAFGVSSWIVEKGHFALSVGESALDLSGHPVLVGSLWAGSAALSVVGWGLRNHQAWARVPAGILGFAASIAVLPGVFITIWALVVSWLCISSAFSLTDERFERVLSDEYGATVRATPELSPPSYAWVSAIMTALFVLALISSLMPDEQSAPASAADEASERAMAELGLWEESCTRGEAVACHNAAVVYDVEEVIERDIERALALYERACDGGFAISCVNLGIFFATGDGVEVDRSRAEVLFARACDHGTQEGCENLRRLHRKSIGYGAASE